MALRDCMYSYKVKSHVAKAVTYQATLQGYDVLYLEDDGAFAKYSLTKPYEQSKIRRSLPEPDLLVLDDLFLARRIADA